MLMYLLRIYSLYMCTVLVSVFSSLVSSSPCSKSKTEV